MSSAAESIWRDESTPLCLSPTTQKSKEEKKKKKKHKHEEKEDDLMGGQADEPAVQSEEANEVTEVATTSTSAEVCFCVNVFL